jgi:hypothetical protein
MTPGRRSCPRSSALQVEAIHLAPVRLQACASHKPAVPTRRCFTAPSTPSATRTSSTRGGGWGHGRKTLPDNVTPQEAQRRLEALVRAADQPDPSEDRVPLRPGRCWPGRRRARDWRDDGHIRWRWRDRAYRWRQGTLPVLEGCRSTGEPSSGQRIARRWGVNTAGATAIPTL